MILINRTTRVICQGFTGSQGTFHAQRCLEYGTQLVGGISPKKGGTTHLGLPVFASVREAVDATQATASVIYVPAATCEGALLEAIDAKVPLIVCITEGLSQLSMMRVRQALRASGRSILIGPNCPGVISPGECKIGIMPGNIHKKGRVGIVARSGTLMYEVVAQLTNLGIGQSTCVGIGGDAIVGTHMKDVVAMFLDDDGTDAIVAIGEIGGREEEELAEFLKQHGASKPIVCLVVGRSVPRNRVMGHAGALVEGARGLAIDKVNALKSVAGVHVVKLVVDVGAAVFDLLSKSHERKTR